VNSTITTVFSEDCLYGLCDMAMLGIISLLILLSVGLSLRNYCNQQVRFLKCTLQNRLISNDILLWISKTQNCWEITFNLCIDSFENLQLLINHIQIVYWIKEKIIWELIIIDKPHSNCVLNEGNKHLRTFHFYS